MNTLIHEFGEELIQSITTTLSNAFYCFGSSDTGTVPQTISIDGIFNKWSGIGLGAWIYGMLPVKQLPQKAKAKTLGKALLSGGVLGGLFSTGNPHNTNLLTTSRPALTVSSSQVSYT